jgi:hypothetical protein
MSLPRSRLCLAALVCLASCSVQMAYNNLDRLARWSVSDYVDMDDAQRAYFDASFAALWGWHRRDHLPQYAAFVDGLAERFEETTGEAQMQALVDRIVAWAQEIEDRAHPVAVELLASLSQAQLDDLARALEESNQEMVEPELDVGPDEARALWREAFAERFTGFSGRLNAVQNAYLDSQAADYQPEALLWVEYRRRWQQDFLALLAHRRDLEGLDRGLSQLAAHRELYFSRELSAVYDQNNRLTREVSVWLINSLTERQRQRFLERLGDLADDFRALAADTRRRRPTDGPPPCLVHC